MLMVYFCCGHLAIKGNWPINPQIDYQYFYDAFILKQKKIFEFRESTMFIG